MDMEFLSSETTKIVPNLGFWMHSDKAGQLIEN